jgi:hypothetical protein
MPNTFSNVANTTLAGDTCSPVIVPAVHANGLVSAPGRVTSPVRP